MQIVSSSAMKGQSGKKKQIFDVDHFSKLQQHVQESEPSEGDLLQDDLTSDQKFPLHLIRLGLNIFLTGAAGTGKSYVLHHLIRALKEQHGNTTVHVTASTGVAAAQIGGVTLHSFAGIGLGKGDPKILVKKMKEQTVLRWRQARALIVDEVSMLDSDFFDKIDYVARLLKKPGRPFGGLQLVVCGDFFQFSPVGKDARFAFQGRAWSHAVDTTIELKESKRQNDKEFVGILNELRWGYVSASSLAALTFCQEQSSFGHCQTTKLYPSNAEVKAENTLHLNSLPGELLTFVAEDKYYGSDINMTNRQTCTKEEERKEEEGEEKEEVEGKEEEEEK